MASIRDEPTVDEYNQMQDEVYSKFAFNAVYRSDADKCSRQLAFLSNDALDHLVHVAKKLLVLTEAEQRRRKAKQGERTVSNDSI